MEPYWLAPQTGSLRYHFSDWSSRFGPIWKGRNVAWRLWCLYWVEERGSMSWPCLQICAHCEPLSHLPLARLFYLLSGNVGSDPVIVRTWVHVRDWPRERTKTKPTSFICSKHVENPRSWTPHESSPSETHQGFDHKHICLYFRFCAWHGPSRPLVSIIHSDHTSASCLHRANDDVQWKSWNSHVLL